MVTVLKSLVTIIEPGCDWENRLKGLLAEYPRVSRKAMGFPEEWESSPIWNYRSGQ
jgi:hypothetical protein